jgi:hypothetical protein
MQREVHGPWAIDHRLILNLQFTIMGCSVVRDDEGVLEHVLAENGEPSGLYDAILASIGDDYLPDTYAKVAFKQGLIKSLDSKEELALALWSQVYTEFDRRPGLPRLSPAVQPGFFRLYRGETDAVWDVQAASGEQAARRGQYFTQSLAEARHMSETYGQGGQISFVDVPLEELERFMVEPQAASGEPLAMGLQLEASNSKLFFLPEGEAMKRQPFADAGMLRDENGEPVFAIVRDALGLGDVTAIPKKVSEEAVVRFLKKEGLVERDATSHELQAASSKGSVERIKTIMEWFGLGKLLQFHKEEGKTKISFSSRPADARPMGNAQVMAGGRTNTRSLILFLKQRFPQLQLEFVSEARAQALYRTHVLMQPHGNQATVDFNRVRSFTLEGKVYLVEGRVDDRLLVEEVLHPFVFTIMKSNPGLFKELLSAARKDFPELERQIAGLYVDEGGFTEEDRNEELVAQALSRLFSEEFRTKPPASFRSVLKDLLKWFADLVKDFGAFLGGKGQVVVNVEQLPQGTTLSDIARLLNTFDSQFLVNTKSPKINFSLKPERQAFIDTIKRRSNPLQQMVIDDLYQLNRPANDDDSPVSLDPKTHIYMNELGQRFTSTTTAIGGKFGLGKGSQLSRLFGADLAHIVAAAIEGKTFDAAIQNTRVDNILATQLAYVEIQSLLPIIEENGVMVPEPNAVGYNEAIDQVIKLLSEAQAKKLEEKFALNRLFGNELDHILECLVLKKSFAEAVLEVKLIDRSIAEEAYGRLEALLQGLESDGAIALPQVIVWDINSEIAGMIDLLLVYPDGRMAVLDLKTSKKSVGENSYRKSKYPVGEGSRLEGEKLSKAQRHGIQIGTYKRLLEVKGHEVIATKTYHIHLDIEGEGPDQKVLGFKMEGLVEHLPSENEVFVKKIVPTAIGDSKLNAYREKLGMVANPGDTTDTVDERTRLSEEYQDLLAQLTVKMGDFRDVLKRRIDRLEKVKSIANFSAAKESKQKLSELLMFISEDLSNKQAQFAYGKFLNHAQGELQRLLDFLTDPANKGTEEYIERVLDADTYLSTYEGMTNATMWTMGQYKQRALLDLVQKLVYKTRLEVRAGLEDYILHMLQTNSLRDISEQEWRDLIAEGTDISKLDKYLGDIDTSSDPLVAVAAKVYKMAKLRAMDRADEFMAKLHEHEVKLKRLFGKDLDFEWMLEFDEDGKFTGRYVQKIGRQFYKLKREKQKKVLGKDGKMLQYRKVYGIGGDPDDIAYNKKIYADRQEWYAFTKAEVIKDNQVEDGTYFKYSKEFTDERKKFEYLDKGRWVKLQHVSWTDFRLYELKFYDKIEGYDKPLVQNDYFDGTLLEGVGSARVVKDEFVEIREKAGDGTDMRSEKYMKLMNGMDERTVAQREFYEFFIEHMGKALGVLPASVRRDMLGKVATVRGKYIDKAKRSPTFFKVMAKATKDWFKVRSSTRQSMFDEDGILVNQIPVFFTGRLQDEKYVETIKTELKELEADFVAKKMDFATYKDKRHTLLERLQSAENRVRHDEVDLNLLTNIQQFFNMSANFDEMQQIESSLLAVQQKLEERKYHRLTTRGKKVTAKGSDNAVEFEGKDSHTLERFKAWMQMTFYSSEDLDKDSWEVVAKRFMNLSSQINVGFNMFGPIHNYGAARINYLIETTGSNFISKASRKRALNEFNRKHIPGHIKNWGKKHSAFEVKHFGSKYEALVHHFRMIREGRLGEGKPKKSWLSPFSYGYKGQSAGEYAIQSRMGIGILMDTQIKHATENTSMSIFDAYDFDEDTQTLTLKEGFSNSLDRGKEHSITNKIWEVNKKIHGNYAWEDRTMIEKSVLGQMAMQFHKWVYPMYKTRYARAYFDENQGEMVEGRHRTVLSFLEYFNATKGTFREKLSTAGHGMAPHQIRNLYRTAAEIGFFFACLMAYHLFKSLASGVDKDDWLLKRSINYFSWESSRLHSEILFWLPGIGAKEQFNMVKNPFAVGTTLSQFSDVLYEMAKLPMPPYDGSAYYKRGPFKGDLKLGKEARDLLPILRELNRWATFDNVTNFHIQ